MRSFVLRILLPRTVLFATLGGALFVGQVMAVNPLAAPADAARPSAPVWTAADQVAHPDCVPTRDWPAGRPADAVVVHAFRDDTDRRMAFDAAWETNHNTTATDDVWVVGVCP